MKCLRTALLISCICCFTISAHAATELSVVTWNTQDALRYATTATFNAFARVTDFLNADVYAFQELPGAYDTIDNLILLRDSILPGYYIIRSENNDNYNRQAIFSRYPLRNGAEVVTNTASGGGAKNFTRELLWAQVTVPDGTFLNVYTAHLKAGTEGSDVFLRETEANAIAAYIKSLQDDNADSQIVVVGDMNTDPDYSASGTALDILQGDPDLTLTDAEDLNGEEWTWTGDTTDWSRLAPHKLLFTKRRYDHQLIASSLTDSSSMVFRAELSTEYPAAYTNDSRMASDHYPVYHTYTLNGDVPTNIPHIIITEADLFRSGDDRTNEYVELYNAGNVNINLQYWQLNDMDSDGEVISTNSAVVLPGHYVLIKSTDTNTPSDATSAGDGVLNLYIPQQFDYSNTDDQLVLINPDGFPVDGVIWNDHSDTVASYEISDFAEMSMLNWQYTSVTNATDYNARTVDYDNKDVLFRWREEAGGYDDTNMKEDWTASDNATPGTDNPVYYPPPDVLITELALWQGSSTTQSYIELYNQGDFDADISGLILTDKDGTDSTPLSSTSALLKSHDFALVYLAAGVNETSSAPDGVISLYGADANIKIYDKGDSIALMNGSEIMDAVAYYVRQDVAYFSAEISDLADLCPEQWNYIPDPTTEADFFNYAVYGSADALTNMPPEGYGIARAQWDSAFEEFFDVNKRTDWFSEEITPGDYSTSIIPEPSLLLLIPACLYAFIRRK